jgi:hypothetical protein
MGMNVGDQVKVRLDYGMQGSINNPVETGRVIYIHPEGRYYTAEFRFEKGTFRESFPIQDPARIAPQPVHPGVPGYKPGPHLGGYKKHMGGHHNV